MEAGKGDLRSLSLVAIVLVFLLGRVAEAGNPCYAECFQECSAKCFVSPACIGSCAYTCGLSNTCKDSSFVPRNFHERVQGNANHYCKVGCTSSICSAIATTLQLDSSADPIGEEAVKKSVERCNSACSEVCTKGFGAPVVTA